MTQQEGHLGLAEDGHVLFSSADSMENPAEFLLTSRKNTGRGGGVQQHFQGIEGVGKARSSHCFQGPPIFPWPSSQLLPALSLWISPGRTRKQSQGRDGGSKAGSALPSLQHPRFVAPPLQDFGASCGQGHPEGGMRSCPWGRTQLLEHLPCKHLLKSPKRQQDPKGH